jgi:hypothetical protein
LPSQVNSIFDYFKIIPVYHHKIKAPIWENVISLVIARKRLEEDEKQKRKAHQEWQRN